MVAGFHRRIQTLVATLSPASSLQAFPEAALAGIGVGDLSYHLLRQIQNVYGISHNLLRLGHHVSP